MKTEVTTYHLEMNSPEQLIMKPIPNEHVMIIKSELPSPSLNLFFFMAVGLPHRWYSRLKWTYSEWETYLKVKDVHTYLGYHNGTPFGYYEFEKTCEDIEITFFGLLPEFTDLGLGGWFLTRAVEDAWKLNPKRVWTHTCDQDHPAALHNYLARGFTEFNRVTEMEELPEPNDPLTLAPNFWKSYLGRFQEKQSSTET